MSVEQLVFIALFILVPLVRTILERHKQRQAEKTEELFETTASQEVPRYQGYDPPAWPAPDFPAPAHVPASPPPAPNVPTPNPRAEVPEPPRRLLADPVPSLRTLRARSRAGVPQNRAELRRALLLVEILGPPRALEPRAR